MRKARVFLSYGRLDQERVVDLYNKLLRAGFDPWMDKKNLLAGEKFEPIIVRRIRRSDFVLVCLTKRSVNRRGFLQKEIRIAYEVQQRLLDQDIYLIPVRLEKCRVPDPLAEPHWVDLFEPDGWKNLLKALNIEIKRRLRKVSTAGRARVSKGRTSTRKGRTTLSRPDRSHSIKTAPKLTETERHTLSANATRITEALLPQEWLPDLGLFRRTITRTRFINAPRMDVFSLKKNPATSSHILIATVSMGGDFSDLTEIHKNDYRIWIVEDIKRGKQLREEFLEHLRTAANAGAKLICFNELAYPTPIDAKGEKPFKNQISKLVAEHELSLIAGSYHHPDKFHNLCPVIATDDRGQPQTTIHAKMTSVARGFESIRVPPSGHSRYYQTVNGVFAILLGNDVYDPSLVFRLIMKNHLYSAEEKIDFVFVPSFTSHDGKALAQACRDLSYSMANLVVYVNCAGDAPRHAAFLAGEELKRSNRSVKCEARSISDNVMLYKIGYDEYQRVRAKVSDSYSPITDYLLGNKDGISVHIKI